MTLKKNTEIMNLGGAVTEAAPNTFTQAEISLPLDSLSREVFVVTDVWVDASLPETIPATNTSCQVQVTRTSQTSIINCDDPDLIGLRAEHILGGVGEFSYADSRFPGFVDGSGKEPISIIATPNFFVAVQGGNNVAIKQGNVRLTGFRAVADSAVYSALLAEQIN